MNQTQAKFYFELLKKGEKQKSQIGKTIQASHKFKALERAGILTFEGRGRGECLVVTQPENYQKFLAKNFPQGDPTGENAPQSAIESNARLRNSKKSTHTKTDHVIFLRGTTDAYVNGERVSLTEKTEKFGLFATKLDHLRVEKLCFIENKDTFLCAEKIIPKDYILFHPYGSTGEELVKKIEAKEILVFPDYDYVGLNTYLRFKEKHPQTRLYTTEDYDFLYANHSTPFDEKKKKPSELVLNSKDPVVIEIREQLEKNHKFLEQQALFY